jgi:hypothetical protein
MGKRGGGSRSSWGPRISLHVQWEAGTYTHRTPAGHRGDNQFSLTPVTSLNARRVKQRIPSLKTEIMKTQTSIARTTACAAKVLPLLLLLTLPAAAQAQFTFTTNDGTITITGYHGSGGVVTIPDTINGLPVTSIGGSTLYGRSTFYLGAATNVVIPNSVTRIGEEAFAFCTRLTSITLSDGVTSIGTNAFAYCVSLTNVTIPNSVTNIGLAAFAGCSNLIAFTVDPLNHSFSSVNGVLFDKNQTLLIQCPPGAIAGSYSIPHTVVSLADYAFMYCMALTEVTIPRSVASIGNYAFYSCTNLTNVFFLGNAPSSASLAWATHNTTTTLYYLPDTLGWGSRLFGLLWNPKAQSPGVRGSHFGFDIHGTANIPVVVEASTDLASGKWTPLQMATLTNGVLHFSDPQWTNHPVRFYRLRSP